MVLIETVITTWWKATQRIEKILRVVERRRVGLEASGTHLGGPWLGSKGEGVGLWKKVPLVRLHRVFAFFVREPDLALLSDVSQIRIAYSIFVLAVGALVLAHSFFSPVESVASRNS